MLLASNCEGNYLPPYMTRFLFPLRRQPTTVSTGIWVLEWGILLKHFSLTDEGPKAPEIATLDITQD